MPALRSFVLKPRAIMDFSGLLAWTSLSEGIDIKNVKSMEARKYNFLT